MKEEKEEWEEEGGGRGEEKDEEEEEQLKAWNFALLSTLFSTTTMYELKNNPKCFHNGTKSNHTDTSTLPCSAFIQGYC